MHHRHSNMAKSSFLLFTPLALLLLLGQSAVALDFCVGDLSAEVTPSGYPCRNPKAVTVSDFAFSGLAAAANVKNAIMAAVTPAFASQFPALNGLGISAARLDLAPNGVIPLHIHPAANEVLLVTQGQICAGFIDTNNKVFSKTLNAGELMVFPRGLLHYQINVGSSAAVGFPFFSSPLPGLQIVPLALFQGDIPSAVIEKTTFLADAEVKRLKNFFGGTN